LTSECSGSNRTRRSCGKVVASRSGSSSGEERLFSDGGRLARWGCGLYGRNACIYHLGRFESKTYNRKTSSNTSNLLHQTPPNLLPISLPTPPQRPLGLFERDDLQPRKLGQDLLQDRRVNPPIGRCLDDVVRDDVDVVVEVVEADGGSQDDSRGSHATLRPGKRSRLISRSKQGSGL
jgi:hypothetical protein